MKKIATITTLLIAVAVTGCANTEEVNSLTEQVNTLSAQVTSLSDEVLVLKDQQETNNVAVQEAKEASEQAVSDAKMANERIDNVVTSYKK